ncbi:myrosinase 1-like [Battus philenor]|uniref:myrosinase 1-like n=1 Tax=Battus philenor TaxID=42288 RepID=UPI0035D0C7E1
MTYLKTTIYCFLISAVWCQEHREFPPGFLFGAATSSYQIEGAWNASDKGENIWDRYVHTNPSAIKNQDTGDIAADSYHKWERDINMTSELGLHFYRFSLSWARLLPTGYTNQISEDGKNYYNNLINGLLARGVQPVVTLYHWDLPQPIQDIGGWTNPLIVDIFAEYAAYAFSIFGDRVKTWITINEAIVICDLGYNTGMMAPGILEPMFAPYLCNKYILLAHAKAYRIYDKYFRSEQHGKVSLANNLLWIEPLTPDDEELAELGRQHYSGRYSHPIYSKEGGWPPSIEKLMAEYSRQQGFSRSRLPAFTEEEIKLMKGSFDFHAFNHYTTNLIRPAKLGEDPGVWFLNGSRELNAVLEVNSSWPQGASQLMRVYPEGIRRLMSWLKEQYGDVELLITENGYSNTGHLLNDENRIQFIRDYLEQVLLSIWEDDVKVIGYTYWSLMDNFEWIDGYGVKFGLYEVDFDDHERTRTPRASAQYYSNIIRTNTLDLD